MCNATLSFYHCTQSGSAKFDEVLCIRIKPAFSFTCIFYMVIFQLCDTLILESFSMYLSIYLDSIFIYSVCVHYGRNVFQDGGELFGITWYFKLYNFLDTISCVCYSKFAQHVDKDFRHKCAVGDEVKGRPWTIPSQGVAKISSPPSVLCLFFFLFLRNILLSFMCVVLLPVWYTVSLV